MEDQMSHMKDRLDDRVTHLEEMLTYICLNIIVQVKIAIVILEICSYMLWHLPVELYLYIFLHTSHDDNESLRS